MEQQAQELVDFDTVVKRFDFKNRQTLDRLIDEGLFPRPVKIGKRAIRWVKTELDAWYAARLAERGARHSASESVTA